MDEDQSIVDWDGGGSKVMYVATRSPHPRILSIGSLARVCFARACAVPRLYARRPQLLPIQKARRSRSLCRESCPLSPRRILPRRPALSPHRSPRSVYIPSACLRTVCILFASCLHPVCACLRPACVLPAPSPTPHLFGSPCATGGADTLKVLLHKLCIAVTKELLTASNLCDLLANSALVPSELLPRIGSDLADTFWFIGLEVELEDAEGQGVVEGGGREVRKKLLVGLIQELLREKVVSEALLKTRLDAEMLQDAGLIKDHVDFHRKQVRLNTSSLYTQRKYNLFREESEGYSKLITELNELPGATAAEVTSTRGCTKASEVVANIQSLIGYFDLDPNRVLDLVLEALEAVPSRVQHRALISVFNPSYIPHTLGFKFQQYHARTEPPPESLYKLTGLLLTNRIVALEQLLPHIGPTVAEMHKEHSQRVAIELAAAKKVGQV